MFYVYSVPFCLYSPPLITGQGASYRQTKTTHVSLSQHYTLSSTLLHHVCFSTLQPPCNSEQISVLNMLICIAPSSVLAVRDRYIYFLQFLMKLLGHLFLIKIFYSQYQFGINKRCLRCGEFLTLPATLPS